MKLHAAYWVTAGVLAVAGIAMMGCAFVQRAKHPDTKSWSDSFEDFENLELKAGYCTVKFEPVGAEEECRIDFVDMPEDTEAYLDGDTLVIEDKSNEETAFRLVSFGDFNWQRGEITIYLPEKEYDKFELAMGVADTSVLRGFTCDTLVIDAGVGNLELTDAAVKKGLDLDCGTGNCTMRGLTIGGKSDIDCGVGTFRMEDVRIEKKSDIDVGTGDFDVTDCEFADLELDGGVGDLRMLSTKLRGDVDITLGTGDIEMELLGDPMHYNFDLDSGMGDVSIDGSNIKTMNNYDAKYELKADSGTGDVDIRFCE